MNKTKIDHINKAFKHLKISGITVDPAPEDIEDALEMLEDMMSDFESRNICTNYNFEDLPDANTEAGNDPAFNIAVSTNLAIHLADYYGKQPSQMGYSQARSSVSNWMARTAKVNMINPPRTMPRGSGNNFRFPSWRRFYRIEDGNPIDCDTLNIKVGEVNTFGVDFGGYLNAGETITSFTITAQPEITVQLESNTDEQVNFELLGVKAGASYLTIDIVTSSSRALPQRVNINVNEV